jgi:adenosylcobinamide-GDP ribazoletransferase
MGLLIGGVLAGLDFAIGETLPPSVKATVLVVALTFLTGGLHLEGLGDAADGLFGGKFVQERLRIMREPTLGAYGVIAIALVLLLKTTAIASLPEPRWAALVLFPVLGRWSMAWAIVSFPYARTDGLGSAFRAGRVALTLASLTAFVATAALFQVQSIVPLAGTAIAAMAATGLMLRRLRGLTGDCYGALNEVCETAALIALVALPAVWP